MAAIAKKKDRIILTDYHVVVSKVNEKETYYYVFPFVLKTN